MRRDTQFTSELLAGEPAVTSLCQTSCLNIIPVAVLETLQNRMSEDGDAPPPSHRFLLIPWNLPWDGLCSSESS